LPSKKGRENKRKLKSKLGETAARYTRHRKKTRTFRSLKEKKGERVNKKVKGKGNHECEQGVKGKKGGAFLPSEKKGRKKDWMDQGKTRRGETQSGIQSIQRATASHFYYQGGEEEGKG